MYQEFLVFKPQIAEVTSLSFNV